MCTNLKEKHIFFHFVFKEKKIRATEKKTKNPVGTKNDFFET